HRRDFTVFSGLSHRGYPATHDTQYALLTGAPAERVRFSDVRNTISLDQFVASRLDQETRFPFLSLGGGINLTGGALSWNSQGVMIPSEGRATRVFKQLFIDGTPEEVAREVQRLQTGHSILDGVRDQTRSLAGRLGPGDRQRLDLLLTSIREAERRLQQEQAWVERPKPKVLVEPFTDDYFDDLRTLDRERQWYDLVHLALATDSTRVIALWLWSYGRVDLEGVTIGHHDATHHGQDDAKIRQLASIEEVEMKRLAEFLEKMKSANDGGPSLLDQTIVFYGSNLGNGSAHTCDNLPVLLAGGGFKHAGHVAFDHQDNLPLSNLFVRILQQMGIESDRFGSSTGTLSEV
ncbi:MAG TPA: DUF1552 domain-containing protein, partial [Pirellulales bacterium]|nr:DUF1552 domain-containing protein [Pirellulales bacterium]